MTKLLLKVINTNFDRFFYQNGYRSQMIWATPETNVSLTTFYQIVHSASMAFLHSRPLSCLSEHPNLSYTWWDQIEFR